jgi:hypothetical protein
MTTFETIHISLFDEIINASKLLQNHTHPNDVLVFIGQSPNYLSYIVEKYRNVIRVPMSGRLYIDEWTIPSDKQLSAFKRMLDNIGLSELITLNKHLILIDHSHSGQSINSFGKLLNILYKKYCSYDFINIVSPVQADDGWIKCPDQSIIKTIYFLQMPGLVDLANDKYPRSIPRYPYWEWLKPFAENDIECENGITLISNLLDYHTKMLDIPTNPQIIMRYPIYSKNNLISF